MAASHHALEDRGYTMKITHLIVVMAIGVCVMIVAGMLMPGLTPWLAQESIFEFTARERKNSNPAEPGTAPNGGPATPIGNSEVTDGSPSVS